MSSSVRFFDPSFLGPAAVAVALATTTIACGPESTELLDTATTASGVGAFTELTGFGSNPGALRAYTYIPSPAPAANAPLVLALHACSQTATDYQKAGWNALADEWGFYVLYPEQTTSNNGLRCFNWAGEYSDPTNLRRGEGENQSIVQMIDKMKMDHSIDARRVFVMGHSGGAAQTALMLATWPDVFAGGAMIAGIPYNCTTSFNEVTTCLNPGINRTPQEYGDRARAGDPGYSGPWPKVSIWHGTADSTVNLNNATELLEQWTNVHGIDTTPDATEMVDGQTREKYQDAGGDTKVELIRISGMNHGTPVRPSQGCGQAGAYFLDAGICASRRIGEFWGIDAASMPGDTQPPTVNISAPAGGMNVTGTVMVRVDASDNTGVDRVELFVNGTQLTTMTAQPYTYSWNTSLEANGTYTLRAVAYDAAGNSATDDDTSVIVMGGVVDTMAPTVNLTAPATGATVSGAVTLSADANDDHGVARVEFFVDGASVGTSMSAPYTASWNTSGVSAGSHAISVKAFDSAGNSTTDDDTTVTVMMSMTDTTPPTVTITVPAANATVGGLIRVQLDASDDVGLKTGLLFMEDELIGSDYRPPFEFLWDTETFPEGPHHLTARVFDIAGNVGLDEIDVVIEHGAMTMEPGDGEPVVVGRKYWGCSAAGAAPADSWIIYVALVVAAGLLSRRRRVAVALAAVVFGSAACGGDDIVVNGRSGGSGKYSSASKISAFLDGKTLTMEGTEIPSHPNGYDQNVNFGQATQCYHKVVMTPLAGRFHVVSELGTLMNAPDPGTHGQCERTMMSAELSFDSTAVLIENVRDNGGCFDFTVTYPGFGQEGRASLSPDGEKLVLEIFFKDQAIGHRCGDGDVGDATVTLSQMPFTGDARQSYVVSE